MNLPDYGLWRWLCVKNLKEAVEFLENGNYKKYDVPEEKEIYNEEIDFCDVKLSLIHI